MILTSPLLVDEVAHNLTVHVFSVVGLLSILQHDNRREFCSAVIKTCLCLTKIMSYDHLTNMGFYL
jgi:hypothetical protein